ncbi:MAG: hypothetical protein PHQ52_05020 [Candidatus Omnitrophica bacterium]|nr:hypothetical protein [Candidatus Omnitrophota bacterium]
MKKMFFVLMFSFLVCSLVIADDVYDNDIDTSDLNDDSSQIDREMDNNINMEQGEDSGFEQDAPAQESDEQLDQEVQTDLIDNAIV